VERVDCEPVRLFGPGFADGLVGGEAAQGLEATADVVGGDGVSEVRAPLIVRGGVEALDGGLLEGAVYSLDWPSSKDAEAWSDGAPVVLGAGELERVGAEPLLGGEHPLDLVRRPGVAAGLGDMRAVVGENRVNLVRNGRDQGAQEVACDTAGDLLMQLDKGDLGRAVDRNKQGELALLRPQLGDVNGEEADRVALDLGPLRFVTVCVGQARPEGRRGATNCRGAEDSGAGLSGSGAGGWAGAPRDRRRAAAAWGAGMRHRRPPARA
jgi:hypothetical protein